MNLLKNVRLKIVLATVAVLLVLSGALAYYFNVYSKTPEYAVGQITEAVKLHDANKFARYVDLDSIAQNGYDDFTEGILDTQSTLSGETLAVIRDFGRIIKNPMIAGFKKAVMDYVETGSWENNVADEDGIDTDELISRLGFVGFEVKSIDSVKQVDADKAVGNITLIDRENGGEFVLEAAFVRENGDWRLNSINNVHDYIVTVSKARRQKLLNYLAESEKIIVGHDEKIREADFEFQKTLNQGSLGKDATRYALKQIMENTVVKDWKLRKEELSGLTVPTEAVNLQRLRLRICDLHIAYAEGYSQWMSDKKVATIRAAEGELKQARTLEGEAAFLLQRMTGNVDNGR